MDYREGLRPWPLTQGTRACPLNQGSLIVTSAERLGLSAETRPRRQQIRTLGLSHHLFGCYV